MLKTRGFAGDSRQASPVRPVYNADQPITALKGTGILREPPVVTDLAYNILEPAVDVDGNDIDGVRSTTLQAPLGTYMGWN